MAPDFMFWEETSLLYFGLFWNLIFCSQNVEFYCIMRYTETERFFGEGGTEMLRRHQTL